LHYALLWSGVSSNTAARLAKHATATAGATRAELAAAASAVAATWRGGQAADIGTALHDYAAALRRFDVEHDLGIYAAGHAALADAGESHGVVYKPCGAGGGDLGIAIATDSAALAGFVALAEQQAFRHLPMAIEVRGLRNDGELL
jgi:phosphomevalonate kinase